ncbi:MAG: homoserine dehydrogenase [Clostridia bacterium]|nr:homoserine dehydrogenase [Clostridia bacterium]
MERIAIGFLGCGNIGSAVYRLLEERGSEIEINEGVAFEVKKILVRDVRRSRGLNVPEGVFTDDPQEVVNDPDISIILEFMGGEQPAADYVIRALRGGKTVVTANKMALSLHWKEMLSAARSGGAGLYFEASVCGAVPVIRAMSSSLQANRISSVMGIINGTTNYILSRMSREGAPYDAVLADAQRLGLAEPDPTADVEGYDAAYKLSILAMLAFHRYVSVGSIYREGITEVTPLDVQCGQELGLTLKLLAVAKESDGKIQLRVHPTFVPDDHPLASVSDAFNAVYIDGHACGETMFYGRGAGPMPTASALVSDLICAGKAKRHELPAVEDEDCPLAKDWSCEYFVRMRAVDEPGVLALIAGEFARYGISISSMIQKGERDESGYVQLIFLTHKAREHAVRQALKGMDSATIAGVSMIRVEGR